MISYMNTRKNNRIHANKTKIPYISVTMYTSNKIVGEN